MDKIKIFHFHNGSGGGVLSVIRNLLLYSQHERIENHVIYTINKNELPKFELPNLTGAKSEQVFYYSPKWNFYYTSKQLAILLPDENAVIVAHDWLELGMASNLGLQNHVIHILHGDFNYYYQLAKKNNVAIDHFISISPKVFQNLNNELPDRRNDISYKNFPVQCIDAIKNVSPILRIVYFVRDLTEERKQFKTVLALAQSLANEKHDYFFTIAGKGYNSAEFFDVWPSNMRENVKFLGEVSNNKIGDLLASQDIFLMPSLLEGFPVSLVEAMKAGVVPLITDWDGATKELVVEGVSGYYLKIRDHIAYADKIRFLQQNRELLCELSKTAKKRADEMFEPIENTANIENVFMTVSRFGNKIKPRIKVYGSRLDNIYIPNFIVNACRKYLKNILKNSDSVSVIQKETN